MILSFAWTTPAVVLMMKTETRRDWSPRHLAQWVEAVKRSEGGHMADAYDRSPRLGGKPVGTVRVNEIVPQEDASLVPDEAWENEGFSILQVLNQEFTKGYTAADVWRFWRQSEPGTNIQTVVRFNHIALNDYGIELQERYGKRWMDSPNHSYPLSQLRLNTKGVEGWEKI